MALAYVYVTFLITTLSVVSNLKKKRMTPEVDLDKLAEEGEGKKRRSFKKQKHGKR